MMQLCKSGVRPWLAIGVVAVALWSASCAGQAQPKTAPPPVVKPAATAPALAEAPVTGESAEICKAALAWFDTALSSGLVEELSAAADRAADRFIAGGTLYVEGQAGFADEMEFRAGGFPFTKFYDSSKRQELRDNDVLFVGMYTPNEQMENFSRLCAVIECNHRYNQGMMFYFASHEWPQIKAALPLIKKDAWKDRLVMVNTRAPAPVGLKGLAVSQMATVATAWALEGEIQAAATRKGKTLATWSADAEPGSREWDKSVTDLHVHPKYNVPPIPAGQMARKYLEICRADIAKFAATQGNAVHQAGASLAECMNRGELVWTIVSGHFFLRGGVIPPELDKLYLVGREYQWRGPVAAGPQKGQMIYYFGYLDGGGRMLQGPLDRGLKAVLVSAHAATPREGLVQVRNCFADWDTVIDLPGYPIRMLPASGVVCLPQWYSILSEIQANTPKAAK